MVELPRSQRLNLPLAPLAAGVLAALVAAFFAFAPAAFLGNLVLDSGIASLVPAAEPPLGLTARAALIMMGAGGVGLIAWFGLYLVIGSRSIALAGPRIGKAAGDVPILRRADAHPDAPARRPLFANSDLGTPFLDVRAKHVVAAEDIEEAVFTPAPPPVVAEARDIPLDLDTPIAAFDAAPLDEPTDWFPKPAQLKPHTRPQVFDDGERFETFELTPMAREPIADPVAVPATSAAPEYDPSASIHALLDRLEKRVGRAPVETPEPRKETLQESLASLRKLATSR